MPELLAYFYDEPSQENQHVPLSLHVPVAFHLALVTFSVLEIQSDEARKDVSHFSRSIMCHHYSLKHVKKKSALLRRVIKSISGHVMSPPAPRP